MDLLFDIFGFFLFLFLSMLNFELLSHPSLIYLHQNMDKIYDVVLYDNHSLSFEVIYRGLSKSYSNDLI